MKKIIFFILAVAVSFIAATYRWGDSAHSIGVIKVQGGEAKHPSFLESGRNNYSMIATATVIPPYKGDVKVVLQGEPEIDYKFYLSNPVIDFGLKRHPELKGNILYGLEPKDRIALWVLMKPPLLDPICGMAQEKRFARYSYERKDYFFCSEGCLNTFKNDPEKYKDRDGVKGKYTLAFYDTKTGRSVLNVPIIFKGKGDAKDAAGHHH